MRTVNVIAVVKVLDVEGGANGHQLLKPRPRDEQTAGEIEMQQQRESSTLRQTPQAEIRDLIASRQAEEPECPIGS